MKYFVTLDINADFKKKVYVPIEDPGCIRVPRCTSPSKRCETGAILPQGINFGI